MKKIVSGLVIYIISTNLFGQQNAFNLENELQEFKERGGRVEQYSVNPLLTKLIFKDATAKVFYFNENKNVINDSLPATIINVWEIDTTLYSHKFKFWQKVDIVNGIEEPVHVVDIDRDGFLEMYGLKESNHPFAGPVIIYEQGVNGKFYKVYTYDSNSVFVQGIGDVDGDGVQEIHLRTNDTLNGKFYKADSLGALPTTFDFIFYYFPNQIGNETFGDFDNNQIIDCLFIDGNNPSKVIVSEFRDSINNFKTTFELIIEGDVPVGFAIGDFDEDRKTEMVFGTALKKLYVIEAIGNNHYEVVWQGNAPTYSAYMLASTNDIDGNGKKEFWVGGQDFNTGISTFWCYETDGFNYYPVASIELRYLLTLNSDQLLAVDIDNDNKEELIILLGNHIIVLTFTGTPDNHDYKIFYMKNEELTQPVAEFRMLTIVDLNKDGLKDILLPMNRYANPVNPLFSYLLIQDTTTTMMEESESASNIFNLLCNFPNPFNPTTTIKFVVSKETRAKISVYDILGKEVNRLLDGQLSSGDHTIQWNGNDSNNNKLPAGVYFIRMIADSYHKTIKAVLTK